MGEGSYRILVNSDGETIVDVRKGSAEISTPQGSTRVERDQRITIQGTRGQRAVSSFRSARQRRLGQVERRPRPHHRRRAKAGNTPIPTTRARRIWTPTATGRTFPTTAACGFPRQGAGWAPYRDGRWVYEPYYGWTWVSYEPWGWAPYHYGRWFVYGGNWGWWPGPVYAGYQPALGAGVRFVLRLRRRRVGSWISASAAASATSAGCPADRATASSRGTAAASTA